MRQHQPMKKVEIKRITTNFPLPVLNRQINTICKLKELQQSRMIFTTITTTRARCLLKTT